MDATSAIGNPEHDAMQPDRTKTQEMPTPRWVKGFAILGVVVLVLVVLMLATGHGPWNHVMALAGAYP